MGNYQATNLSKGLQIKHLITIANSNAQLLLVLEEVDR